MIAAALGNTGNRRSFARGFFRDEPRHQQQAKEAPRNEQIADTALTGEEVEDQSPADDRTPSMKQLLEAACVKFDQYQNAWKMAKKDFLSLQKEFEDCRKLLERAEEAACHIDNDQSRLNGLLTEAQMISQDTQAREMALSQIRQTEATQRAVVEGSRVVLEQLRSSTPPNLWDRVMKFFGRETSRMAALRQSLEAPNQDLSTALAALSEVLKEVAIAEAQLRQQRERQKAISSDKATLERGLDAHRRALQEGYATGAKHFPTAQFWALPADERHRASVAVGPKLDELRARLFLQAVDLHRLTILANAGKFIANLRAVNGMLTGSLRDKLLPGHRPLLWDAFFFIVPVVSTTLASFDRLFVGMGQNSLGWLLIDEAGQATPQSAAGAIWRSKRAVIVGDPLQIEPVFTVPRSLTEELRKSHDVAQHWSPIDESVQTLADRMTRFGSWVEKTGSSFPNDTPKGLWTGMPLRTHRRCDDPMFSVANRIAYAGQMVQGRVDASGQPTPSDFSFSLGESTWFDVRSTHVNHPVSEDEIACLLFCLEQLHGEKGGKTKIYVISPFRKVAERCEQLFRNGKFRGIECGTVHTFQGKEAPVVFLVLGTAPGQTGSGARNWAASKPNLLNVAVTRAQHRLYVIGDASQWRGLNYFSALYNMLPVRKFDAERREIVSSFPL